MRIAILQQSYGRFGGAERLAFSHYVQMKRMKREVSLFYRGSISSDWAKRLQNEQIRTIPSGMAKTPSQARDVHQFIREIGHYDRILIHHHVEPILAYYISKAYGNMTTWYSGGGLFDLSFSTGRDYRDLSLTLQTTADGFYGSVLSRLIKYNSFYNVAKNVLYALDVSTVRGFAKIVANSLFTARALMRGYRLRSLPTFVYPATDPVLERLAAENPHSEGKYILTVAALTAQKNLETLIHAASKVPTAKLIFVGQGHEEQNLLALAKRLGVALVIKTNQDVVDLANDYSGCQLLVHPAIYEPFGLTPLEAGLFAKPSIVTNRGGPCETVLDGETGFVINPFERGNISELMHLLLVDHGLRKEMGRKARTFVRERFSLEKSTKDLLAVIEQ